MKSGVRIAKGQAVQVRGAEIPLFDPSHERRRNQQSSNESTLEPTIPLVYTRFRVDVWLIEFVSSFLLQIC